MELWLAIFFFWSGEPLYIWIVFNKIRSISGQCCLWLLPSFSSTVLARTRAPILLSIPMRNPCEFRNEATERCRNFQILLASVSPIYMIMKVSIDRLYDYLELLCQITLDMYRFVAARYRVLYLLYYVFWVCRFLFLSLRWYWCWSIMFMCPSAVTVSDVSKCFLVWCFFSHSNKMFKSNNLALIYFLYKCT